MKRILLLLTGFLLAFSVSGQLAVNKAGIKSYDKVGSLMDYQDPQSKGERLDSFLVQSWDNTIPGWVNSMKDKTTYGTGSQVDISYEWDKTTIPYRWVNVSKTESNFDGSGNLTSMILYDWDKTTIPYKWVNAGKTVNTYVNGNNTLSVYSIWDESQWMELGKKESTFYPNGKYKVDITSVNLFLQWMNSTKKEYYYDAAWKDTLDINYSWEMVSSKWELSEKTRFAYNTDGRVILATTYGWDKPSSKWIGLMKIETGYTGEDETSSIVYHWDKVVNPTTGWVYYSKTEQTGSGTLSKSEKWVEMTGYMWDVNKWINDEKITYYYSGQSTSIFNDTYDKSIIVYPNPAREYIIFDLNNISESANVEIYDISGREILNHNVFNNSNISIRNLSKGLYIYMLRINGITYKGKFLKE